MTNREFYEMVISGTVNNEVVAKAKDELAKLDKRNASRKNTKSYQKHEAETAKLIEKMYAVLDENPMTAAQVAEKAGVSTQKVAGLSHRLVERGAKVVDIINNKRVVNGYSK